MFDFLKKELLITYDVKRYTQAAQKLKDNGVKFSTKAKYTGSHGSRESLLGTIGENAQYQTEYKIFVKKQAVYSDCENFVNYILFLPKFY